MHCLTLFQGLESIGQFLCCFGWIVSILLVNALCKVDHWWIVGFREWFQSMTGNLPIFIFKIRVHASIQHEWTAILHMLGWSVFLRLSSFVGACVRGAAHVRVLMKCVAKREAITRVIGVILFQRAHRCCIHVWGAEAAWATFVRKIGCVGIVSRLQGEPNCFIQFSRAESTATATSISTTASHIVKICGTI